MLYTGTRTPSTHTVSSEEAIKEGLSPDGGLYMPMDVPVLTLAETEVLLTKSYAARAAYILGKYLTDYSTDELRADCSAAYSESRFPGGAAPVRRLDDSTYLLELWHGPTAAFKDMALQIMPRLLSRALTKTGETRTALILVATSGDTGKAALEGYRDVPGVKIQVFYPVDGVSQVQKLQMMTQTGNNVSVMAIRGNFDDAQSGVKRIFADEGARQALDTHHVFLSSANSINWGRLAPQIVYYVSAYCDMVKNGAIQLGEPIDICVPTGNFGNIFAAYLAKRMGLPIDKLICASNENNVLTEFLTTGVYDRNRAFHTTMSPSMDILISSNLERLLYLLFGHEKTASCMRSLADTGRYKLTPSELAAVQKTFIGYCTDEEGTRETLRHTWEDEHYLADPHTAVALGAVAQYQRDHGAKRKTLVASTASPYKFAFDVYRSLFDETPPDGLTAQSLLAEKTGVAIPAPLADIAARHVRFTETINAPEMPTAVLRFASDAD